MLTPVVAGNTSQQILHPTAAKAVKLLHDVITHCFAYDPKEFSDERRKEAGQKLLEFAKTCEKVRCT